MPCETPFRDDSEQRLLFKIASCINDGSFIAGVASFNGRSGVVTLTAADVSTALGCTPLCESDGDARYVLKSGDSMTGALSINNGVLAANDPALELSQTWNNAAETFTAFQSDVTATAAAAGSLLFNFRQGGVSVLNLRTDGRLELIGRIAATTTSSIGHSVNTSDALNTAVVNVLTVGHTLSAGVGAAGLGARIDMVGDSATVASQSQLRIDSSWIDPVQATRTSEVDFILPVSGTPVIHLTLTNNQAQLRDGTAALPSLTFQSDADTGIYRIGANVQGVSVGGTRIASWNSVGLGIGTDAATFRLSLVGTASTADRKIGINGVQVVYLPDQTDFAGSLFYGNGGGSLSHTAGSEGFDNTGVGFSALMSVTTGNLNFAIGSATLFSTTTGSANIGLGSNVLFSNTTGSRNLGIGYQALFSNVLADRNIAIGYTAMFANLTGTFNTVVGYEALLSSDSGSSNSVFGYKAMRGLTTGSSNTAFGYQGLLNVTTGTQNTSIGYNTGLGITTGSNNTVLGANVAGLAAGLANNIILADGAGAIRLQIDSSGNTTLAGTVQTAAGTAALPAFSFTGDPNTGLYNIGADSLGLSTGGTLRVTTNTTDLILATAFRLAMASGANQRAGNAVLVGGTVTVANTSVTANTIVMLTRKTAGGTLGTAITYSVIAATSFTIQSDSAIDTSTFSYLLVEVP